MKRNLQNILCLAILLITFLNVHAQAINKPPIKVAVFIPIYINNAFTGSEYKLSKLSLPKNILPGLEFYNGVTMAIDSLEQEGLPLK